MTRQVLGSLLVALFIVAVTIVVVTARLGTTSTAELELREEMQENRIEMQEERLERQEDLREERLEQREDGGGPG